MTRLIWLLSFHAVVAAQCLLMRLSVEIAPAGVGKGK